MTHTERELAIEKELHAELNSRHAVRLRNDINGNPRFCIHWTFLESQIDF